MSNSGKNLIDELNRQMKRRMDTAAASSSEEVVTSEQTLEKYKALLASNGKFDLSFNAVECPESGGVFSTIDNGVLLLLPFDHMNDGDISDYKAARLLGVSFKLAVDSIDEENKKVICRFAVSREERTKVMAIRLNKVLKEELSKKNYPRVIGRIERVEKSYAIVNILNTGVYGKIDARNWQPCYTRMIKDKCSVGDYLEFDVAGMISGGKFPMSPSFRLDRTHIAENPWAKLSMVGLEVGSVLEVTCTERPSGLTYWWGKSDRAPGIEILCDYTTNFIPGETVVCGFTYLCRVRKLVVDLENPKECRLSAQPFEIVARDAERLASYRQSRKERALKESIGDPAEEKKE